MTESLRTSGGKRFLLFLVLLVITDLAIFLNIPVLRQVLGFTFFTIIPGVLILRILKVNLGLTGKFVLSVGLSIAFLMLFGFLINQVFPLFGYDTPLSTNSLLITFSIIIVILAIVAYRRNRTGSFIGLSDFKLSTKEKAFLLLPAFFPLLSISGMHLMNTTDNNTILMALLFLIPAYVIFVAVKHQQVSGKVYPLMIFLIGVSLVLLFGLRSNYIIGADVHTDFFYFLQTYNNGKWSIFEPSTSSACLSISILPTIYQLFLNINPEYLFKILYPLIVSILPLVVYLISEKYIGSFYAFLASFLIIANLDFIEAACHARTDVAILFFTLSAMVLFQDRLSEFSKRLLFIIFAISCIASHYSTTYIFFFVLLFTLIGMQIIPRIVTSKKKPSLEANLPKDVPPNSTNLSSSNQAAVAEGSQVRLKRYTTIGIVILFFAMLFLWYGQATGTAFASGVNYITNTLRNLQDFFIFESRGAEVAQVFGVGFKTLTIPRQIYLASSWLIVALIAVGVLTTVAKRYSTLALTGEKGHRPGFLFRRFDIEFFAFSIGCCIVLVAAVALPHIAKGYTLERPLFQMLTVLAPFFVIGGIAITNFIRVKWAYLVALLVLIPYFMCTSGTMYQIFNIPQMITLNSQGWDYDATFIHEEETHAIRWLRQYSEEGTRIYTDHYGQFRLESQGGVRSPTYAISLIKEDKPIEEGYIYLRYCGVVNGKLLDRDCEWQDIAQYQDKFEGRSLLYANGGSEVWK